MFIVISEANIGLDITSKKVLYYTYLPTSTLFEQLYHIIYYKAYILLDIVILPW